MKKWVKKLRGVAIATLVTVALSGKAYAEADEGQIPDAPPQFIAPVSETAASDTAVPVSENNVAAEENRQNTDDGDSDQASVNESAAILSAGSPLTGDPSEGSDVVPSVTDPNDNDDADPVVTVNPDDNGDTVPAVTSNSDDNGDTVPVVTADSDDNGDTIPAVTANPDDNGDTVPAVTADPDDNGDTVPAVTSDSSDSGDADSTVTVSQTAGQDDGDSLLTAGSSADADGGTVVTTDPSGESEGIPADAILTADGMDAGVLGLNGIAGTGENTLTVTEDVQTDSMMLLSSDGTDPDGTGETDLPSEPDTGEDESLQQLDENVYVLVNHDGTEDLSSEGDITVLAAGLNHVSSISGGGTVTVAGTGILLVDSLEGELELQTLTDIYEEGSVAIFIWDEDLGVEHFDAEK